MNTKIKIITILLMTLTVLGGGVLFYSNQLAVKGAGGNGVLFFEDPVALSGVVKVIPEVRADQLDSYKPSSRGSVKSSNDLFSTKPLVETSTSSKGKGSTLLSEKRSSQTYHSASRRDNELYSNRSANGGNDILAYGSRRGGSEISSTGGGGSSALGGAGALYVPYLDNAADDSWALIDPEPQINQLKDKIVPVGDGAIVLALFALIYGAILFRRKP